MRRLISMLGYEGPNYTLPGEEKHLATYEIKFSDGYRELLKAKPLPVDYKSTPSKAWALLKNFDKPDALRYIVELAYAGYIPFLNNYTITDSGIREAFEAIFVRLVSIKTSINKAYSGTLDLQDLACMTHRIQQLSFGHENYDKINWKQWIKQ